LHQAGLFSAVASAFIIQVDSQLRPDPNDETAALLRVLIHKIDNTTFGNDVPTLPRWTGPPPALVQVQVILFASLAASLFSAFLAMLGKQWLNRYASSDMRGSGIERSQNRQRKLDGIVSWRFDSDGVIAVDAAGGVTTPRVRLFPVSLGRLRRLCLGSPHLAFSSTSSSLSLARRPKGVHIRPLDRTSFTPLGRRLLELFI
jgi:hypothetical protein